MSIIRTLGKSPDNSTWRSLLKGRDPSADDELAAGLKAEADEYLRSDIERSLAISGFLLDLAAQTGSRRYLALGLCARGNGLSIGLGQYAEGIDDYDQAAEIYRQLGDPVAEARSQIGRIHALANLGRFEEAESAGQWSRQVFMEQGELRHLATITLNLATVRARLGDDTGALTLFDEAAELFGGLGKQGEQQWHWVQIDRAYVLRNLGDFEGSMAAARRAEAYLTSIGHTASAARARQMLGLTQLVIGENDRALLLLEDARSVYADDGRARDAALVDLFISDVYLQLSRWQDALRTAKRAFDLFTEIGSRRVIGLAKVNQAIAHAGLHHYQHGLSALADARELFLTEKNFRFSHLVDLEVAGVLLASGDAAAALDVARRAIEAFSSDRHPLELGRAHGLAGLACLQLGLSEQALIHAENAVHTSAEIASPSLAFHANRLMAKSLIALARPAEAVTWFEVSARALERITRGTMTEFRMDLLTDLQPVYEEAAGLCLRLGQSESALEWAERSKSMSLRDMVAGKVRLSIEARQADDEPLVEGIQELMAEKERLVRRLSTDIEASESGWAHSTDEGQKTSDEIGHLEDAITASWHRLLLKNHAYAQAGGAASPVFMWQTPMLESDQALVEYFFVGEQPYAFVIEGESVRSIELPGARKELEKLVRLLDMNFEMTALLPTRDPRVARYKSNLDKLLKELHAILLARLEGNGSLPRSLLIVPHGCLHHVPFEALWDGHRYLVERFEMSYLPSAQLIGSLAPPTRTDSQPLVVGHSGGGKLPHAVDEARQIAERLGVHPLLNDSATKTALLTNSAETNLVHIAAHGMFRSDHPLFSGIALDDGIMSVLDVFNLHLSGAHVTLSCCDTGRSAIGGGDELVGLIRGFLHAGAGSLLLSRWLVADEAAVVLMQKFYDQLLEGRPKPEALRQAQLSWLNDARSASHELGVWAEHPYFWAPFMLVGT